MALDTSIIGIKVLSVLRADDTLLSLCNNQTEAFVYAPQNPTSYYPCITIEDIPDKSEDIIPARHGELIITAWCNPRRGDTANSVWSAEPRKTLSEMVERILAILDYNCGSALTEGTVIRVVRFTRIEGGGTPEFDKALSKFKVPIVFLYTMSYHEVGHAHPADTPWV
jgi:hypothetical protein